MSRRQLPAPVVVAVGDGDASDDAVEWAAAEAAARRCRLRVVHVVRRPLVIDPSGLVPLPDGPLLARALDEDVLHAALGRATSVASDLEISGELLSGVPTRGLIELSREAALLVLGGRGGGMRRLLAGSAAEHVVPHAYCPVVVIPQRPDVHHDPVRPRVVVGVGLPRCCPEVLDLAFRAAAQRGVPLVAVHVWGSDAPADLEGVCGPSAATEGHAREQLNRLLAPWQDQFPHVPVRAQLLCADPAAALVTESGGASLLVVGCRGRGALLSMLFGSVSRNLVQRVHVPVAVVHPAPPVRTRTPGGTAPAHRRPRADHAHTEPSSEPNTPWD